MGTNADRRPGLGHRRYRRIPGVRATYHLLDPESGNGLSIAIFDNETAGQAAGAAIRRRAEEIGWNDQPHPRYASETFYQVLRGHP
jgi:hypothetical protein